MRPRLSFANVVSVLALFLALGGGALAASNLGKNSVGSKQLKKNAVTTAKLKNEAITAAKIKKGTLTGTQINVSTLGTVPSAAHATASEQATSAGHATDAANGAVRIDFVSAGIDPPPAFADAPAVHEVFNRDGFSLRVSCINAGSGEVRVYVTVGTSVDARVSWTTRRFTNPGHEPAGTGLPLGAGLTREMTELTGGNQNEIGELIYRNATQTISVLFEAGAASLYSHECNFVGTATSAG